MESQGSCYETEEENTLSTGAHLTLPLKHLVTATATTALRFGVSERQQISAFTLSKGTLNRKRRETIAQKAKVRATYIPPKFANLHWDSKIFKPSGRVQEDRVAIFVSSPPKLLSISVIPTSTGEAQKEACMRAVNDWGISANIVAATFDTAASNTGQYHGAAAVLEQALQRPILWLPCRRHSIECHIKRVQNKVGSIISGPSYKLFARLKEMYPTFAHLITGDLKIFNYDEQHSFIIEQANLVKEWVEKCLKENVFPREDYRELCELIAVFLGVQLPNEFSMRLPGADHHARFMSKAICYLKLYLLQNLFPLYGTEVKEVKRMALYIGVFYGKHLLQSSLTTFVPHNDLSFFCAMHQYLSVDKAAG